MSDQPPSDPYGQGQPPPPPPPPPGGYPPPPPPPGAYGAPGYGPGPGPGTTPLGPGGAPLAEWWQRLVAVIIDSIIIGIVGSIA
ncbi:MAG TPA: hypothetical protein VFO65_06655, partial [Acidimicrobiales bacterium]|nr:hypothetical protein [Acidimicrobiales bacterium]